MSFTKLVILFIFSAILFICLTSCKSSSSEDIACANHNDCSQNQVCVDSLCYPAPSCDGNSNCPLGSYCENGTCQIGLACLVWQDCGLGFDCTNGNCVPKVQTPGCKNNIDCGEGYYCEIENGICMPLSDGNDTDGDNTDGDKTPDCITSNDCLAGYRCDLGKCLKIETPSDGDIIDGDIDIIENDITDGDIEDTIDGDVTDGDITTESDIIDVDNIDGDTTDGDSTDTDNNQCTGSCDSSYPYTCVEDALCTCQNNQLALTDCLEVCQYSGFTEFTECSANPDSGMDICYCSNMQGTCETAYQIDTLPYTHSFFTDLGDSSLDTFNCEDPDEFPIGQGYGNEIVYTIEVNSSQELRFSVDQLDFDAIISIRNPCSNSPDTCIGINNSITTDSETIIIDFAGFNGTVFVVVDGAFSSDKGDYRLTVENYMGKVKALRFLK